MAETPMNELDEVETKTKRFFDSLEVMQVFGVVCLVAGIAWGVWAYRMSTTVYSGNTLSEIREVQNI